MKRRLRDITTHIGVAARLTTKLKESIAEPTNCEQQETLCRLIDDLETIMDRLVFFSRWRGKPWMAVLHGEMHMEKIAVGTKRECINAIAIHASPGRTFHGLHSVVSAMVCLVCEGDYFCPHCFTDETSDWTDDDWESPKGWQQMIDSQAPLAWDQYTITQDGTQFGDCHLKGLERK